MNEKTNSNKNIQTVHTNLRKCVTELKNFLKYTSSIKLPNKAAKKEITKSKILLKCLVDNTYPVTELKRYVFQVTSYIISNI